MRSRREILCALGAALWLGIALPALVASAAAWAAPLPADTPDALRSFVEGLAPAQQERIAKRLGALPERRRTRVFRRFEQASDDERARLLQRLERRSQGSARGGDGSAPATRPRRGGGLDREVLRERLASMSPDQRRAFRRQLQRWRSLEPERRKAMRRRLVRFRELDGPAQEALVERSFPELDADARAARLEALRAAAAAAALPVGGRTRGGR